MTDNRKVKLCVKCTEVKDLIDCYYRAGSSFQKLCKICHNEKRAEYPNKKVYIKKDIGFIKLPEELRNKIIYQIHIQVNFKDICKKYSTEYPQLKHQTLLRWNRLKQIPAYKAPEITII